MPENSDNDPSSESFVKWREFSKLQVSQYQETLNSALVEMDMQRCLEANSNFLTQLVEPGKNLWVIPRKRLGAEYETDFLIAHNGTFGYSWHAVELERPQVSPCNKNGDLSASLNHAIGQIDDWRDWISRNRDYASRDAARGGLGLVDIDPELPGIVIMGRGEILNDAAINRLKRLEREKRIRVFTYDWLAKQAKEKVENQVNNSLSSLFDFLGPMENPVQKKATWEVFGTIGTCWMPVSSVRDVEYEFVPVKVEGKEEREVPVNVQYGTRGKSVSWTDWSDWIDYVGDQIDQRLSLLVSSGTPGWAKEESILLEDGEHLFLAEEGIWVRRNLYHDWLYKFGVFVHIPELMEEKEAERRMKIAKKEFEDALLKYS